MPAGRCEGRPAAVAPRSASADPNVADRDPPAQPDIPIGVKPRRWLLRHWQLPVALAMLVLAYFTLRDHLPSFDDVGDAIRSASVGWIVAAAGCEAVSLGMFARQQRALLAAVAVRMSTGRALAITYARSALAISMPAGSAVSAGFAFQQFRRSGATNDKAAAVMVLSGVVSFLGLASLCVAGGLGLLALQPAETLADHPVVIAVVASLIVIGVVGWLVRARAATWLRRWRPAPSAAIGTPQR
jgi:uncharacterized membrane protein YbhN (UPF0104 family)